MLSRITRTLGTRCLTTIRPFHTTGFRSVTKQDTNEENESKQGRANEIIEAVLYGSKKIKEEERQTHSKVLARGKYVHELQSKLVFFSVRKY